MEGTHTTADNLLLAEAGVSTPRDDQTAEVANYLSALNESLRMLQELPISHRVICRAHEILLSGLSSQRGAQKRPGQYKREQNWIGGVTIDRARFVPPPPAETLQCMDELEKFINSTKKPATPLIDLALVHYQLEAIHPFADGNGRVGRMLISLMSVNSGLLDLPVLYISPVMEQFKDQYIDLMFNVSARGEWVPWLNFFFARVTEACKETIDTIDRLIALQNKYRELAVRNHRSISVATLVDALFERPAITISEAAEKLKVTYAAAKGSVDKLVELGILVEFAGQYPKLFYAPSILNASLPTDSQVANRGDHEIAEKGRTFGEE